jgi:hypothetical protein
MAAATGSERLLEGNVPGLWLDSVSLSYWVDDERILTRPPDLPRQRMAIITRVEILSAERHSTRNSDGYASNSDDALFRTGV